MDVYARLREKLNAHPIGAPDIPEIHEILRILFTPDEAQIALTLTITPRPISEIASKADMDVNASKELCESLANKGLVLAYAKNQVKYYGLLPMMPGVFEYPFMKSKILKLDYPHLAKLWHDYYAKGFGHEYHGGTTSMSRVISVKKSVDASSIILPYEEVENYLEKAVCIAVGDCSCRVAEKKCSHTIKTCLSFDSGARFLVEREMSDFITKTEAYVILENAEREGLVHMTSNTADRINFICNCCPCFCVTLGSLTRLQGAGSHPVSGFVAAADPEKCDSCGACVEKCPTHAARIDDTIQIDTKLCIGCGLCASNCQSASIKLIRRGDNAEPPIDTRTLAIKVATEKGRLNAFLANL